VDISPTMLALLGTIDRVLTEQGVDATVVTEDDKLLIAIQYVETCGIRERVLATNPPEVYRLDPVLRVASHAL